MSKLSLKSQIQKLFMLLIIFISVVFSTGLTRTIVSSNATATLIQAIWVTSQSDSYVTQINASNGIIENQYPVTGALSVAISPDGTTAVVTASSSSVYVFTSADTTSPTEVIDATSLTDAVSAAFLPNGNLFVVDHSSASVVEYSLNEKKGALTAVKTYSTGTTPQQVAVSPNGNFVATVNNVGASITVVTVLTQSAVTYPDTFGGVTALAFSSDSSTIWTVATTTPTPSMVPFNLSTDTFGTSVSLSSSIVPTSIVISGTTAYVGSSGTYALETINLLSTSEQNEVNWNAAAGKSGTTTGLALANGGSVIYASDGTNCSGNCVGMGSIPVSSIGQSGVGIENMTLTNLVGNPYTLNFPNTDLAVSPIPVSQFETPVSLSPVNVGYYSLDSSQKFLQSSVIENGNPLYTRQYPNIDFNPNITTECSNQIGSLTNLKDVVPMSDGTCETLGASGHGFLASSCVQSSFFGYSLACGATDGQGDIYETNYNSYAPVRIDNGKALLSISCFNVIAPNEDITCFSGDSAGNIFETYSSSATFPSQIELKSTFTGVSTKPITGISCAMVAGTVECYAVDSGGSVWYYNGSAWEGWTVSGGSGSFKTSGSYTAIDSGNTLTSISCNFALSTIFCVAVDSVGNFLTYSGGASWSSTAIIGGTGDPPPDDITSVSCGQDKNNSLCEAVDGNGYVWQITGSAGYEGWDSGTWSTGGTYSPIDSGTALTSIDCPVVVGNNEGVCVISDAKGNAFVLSTPSSGSPSLTSQSYDPGNDTVSVGCEPGVLLCDLFDGIGQVVKIDSPTNGSSWSPPINLDSASLNSVSCYSSANCIAVDSSGNAFKGTFSSGSWSWVKVATGDSSRYNSISCITGPFCLAVDSSGNAYYTTDGTSWSQTGSTGDSNSLNSVSCVSTSFCIAVDSAGQYLSYDESTNSWSTPFSIDTNGLNSVSCITGPFCLAVDTAGNAYVTTNGTSWSQTSSTGVTDPLTSVSCYYTNNCVAVDTVGNYDTWAYNSNAKAVIWNGPSSMDPGHFLSSISCPTPTSGLSNSCIIGANDGNIYFDSSNGSGNNSVSNNFDTKGVSCATYYNCVAVDSTGEISYSNGQTTQDALMNTNLNPGQSNQELSNYQMVATSELSVPYPGSVTLGITATGAFNLAFGQDSGGSFPSTISSDPPSNGTLSSGILNSGYQTIAQYNSTAFNSTMEINIYFPQAGVYPLELDYAGKAVGPLELSLGSQGPVPSNILTPSCPSPFILHNYINPVDGSTPFVVCSASGTNRYVSFDQTPIDADLTIPVTSGGKYPLMVQLAGGNGNKTTFETTTLGDTTNYLGQRLTDFNVSDYAKFNNAYYASLGYAVLNYSPRGVAQSCGPNTETASGISYSNMTDPKCRPISAISCPNTSQCIALDSSGHDIVSNGYWQTYLNTGDSNGFVAVSCVDSVAPVFCGGVDDAGNLYYSIDATNYNKSGNYSWSTPNSQVDSGTPYSSIYCISSTACISGDTNGNLIYFNGTTESSPVNDDMNNTITSIFCLSSSDCIATDSAGQVLTFSVSSTGVISIPVITQVANVPSFNTPISLTSVSCVSTSLCIAGDATGNVYVSSNPFSTPSGWSHLTLSSSPIVAVNCFASTSDCFVGDNSGYVYYSSGPSVSSGSWSTIAADPSKRLGGLSCYSDQFCGVADNTDAIVTSSAPSTNPWTSVTNNSVSCISSTSCFGVDSKGDYFEYSTSGIQGPSPTGDTNSFNAVSCILGPFCLGVDNKGNAYYTTDGTTWSQTSSTGDTNSLTSVSCISNVFCMAVDSGKDYLSYDESTNSWSTPSKIDTNLINSVSCVTGPVCVAVDSGGGYLYYTGSTWYGPTVIQGAAGLNSVSCVTASSTYCYVADSNGQVFEIEVSGTTGSSYGWNGAGWTSTEPTGGWTKVDQSLGIQHSFTSISCISTTECAAVDNLGGLISFDGSSWNETDANGDNPLSSITCISSTTTCVAMDQSASRSQILSINQAFASTLSVSDLNPETDEKSWFHVGDKRFDIRDIQGTISTLIDDSIINPNQIVASGQSYGGIQTLGLAFADQSEVLVNGYSMPWASDFGNVSLAAAIPQMTATDIFSALTVNGRSTDSTKSSIPVGVPNSQIIDVLEKVVNPTNQQSAPIGSEDDLISVINALKAGQSYQSNPVISSFETVFNSYHSALEDNVPNPSVPIFIIQGTTDLFFNVTQSEELINKLLSADSTYPVSGYYAGLGHSIYQPVFNWAQAYSYADSWLKQTLLGAPPAPSVTIATTSCGNEVTSNLVSVPTLSFLQESQSTITGSTGSTSTLSSAFDGGGACTLPNSSYVSYQSNGNMTINLPPGQFEFNGDENTTLSPILLTGGITVNANLVTSGIDESISVEIYDVSSEGIYTEITSGSYKLTGISPGKVSFELYPNGWSLLPGHSIEAVIAQQSDQFQPDGVPNDTVNSIRGISCVSNTFCVAVDSAGYSYLYTGSSWSGPTEVDNTASLTSVSCSSNTFCLAVSTSGSAYYSLNGTSWTKTTGDSNPLTSVSCISTSYCAVVDDVGNILGYDEATNSWVTHSGVTSNTLTSVSCVYISSSLYCMTVDNMGNAYSTTDGTTWTKMSSTSDSNGFTSVSCFGISDCMAVDNSGNADYYNGSTWTLSNIDGMSQLTSISCITSNCIISDYNGNIINWTESNSTFSQPLAEDLTTDSIGSYCSIGSGSNCKLSNFITAISCITGFCMAADANGNYLTTTTSMSTWTTPGQMVANESSISGISCYSSSSANDCVAVTKLGEVMYYNGTTWTITMVDPGNSLTSVSCTSSTLCVAVDNAGNYLYSTDPVSGTWSAVNNIDGTNVITSVSCPTATFCGAVDNKGQYDYSASPTTASSWLPPPNGTAGFQGIDTGNSINSISCPTSSLCVAVDNVGNYLYWASPSAYNNWTHANIDSTNSINSVTCTSSTVCVAVDNKGNYLYTNNMSSSGATWSSAGTGVTDSLSSSCSPGYAGAALSNCIFLDTNFDSFAATYIDFFGKISWNISNTGYLDQGISPSSTAPQASCFNSVTPTNEYCLIIDNTGSAFIYNGKNWASGTSVLVSSVSVNVPGV